MKKFFSTLMFMIFIGFVGYYIYINYMTIPKIITEEEIANVNEYFIYGNHLNINGSLKITDINFDDIDIILYDGEEIEYDVTYKKDGNNILFSTSEYINEGMYIDNLDRGSYYVFLRLTYENSDDVDGCIYKYYVLDNNTNYDKTVYYTLSKYDNKIVISSENEYDTFMLKVSRNNTDDVYDITIDPGHGGMDSGAILGKYKEKDFTMDISLKIRDYLEKKNIKVKLTHDKDVISSNETMDEYNEHGRAVIPNEVKSKYTFSIHINKNNSSSVRGIEIYTADGINYDFAKDIANSVTINTDFDYSNNKMYKVYNGVYTHNFTDSEINSSLNQYNKKGYKPFDISTKSNYLYMIRETGGYLTGAYVDDRNVSKVGVNPYYNSNIGNESYLLEIGYLSNSSDFNILLKNKDKLAKVIGDSIIKELKVE